MVKTYVLDTNVLLNDPYSMVRGFEDNEVVVCSTTIQELDSKKCTGGELGYNARLCGKILDSLREKGDLVAGVENESGGITMVEPDGVDRDLLPVGYSIDSADNRIISSCIHIKKERDASGYDTPVILVTDDILMRVSACTAFAYAGVNIGIQGYGNGHINDDDTLYCGYTEERVTSDMINALYRDKKVVLEVPPDSDDAPVENEFITFKCGSQSALTVYQHGAVHLINPEQSLGGWIKPKNELQTYAMWLLKNKDIPLKILIGSAGTGKTFLSLAAGLEDTIGTKKYGAYYDKMLISRPATGFDEIGFMPGDLDEKLRYTNLSYFDNLSVILGHGGEEDRDQVKMQIEDLFEMDTIEVCGLSFIRGRSLINSYLICDEAQNAGASLIRDVISRAGYGTSVVLAGDPRQIDISTLDRRNNGLEYAASKMKGSPLCGIIRFPAEASVRSPLAKEAAERM